MTLLDIIPIDIRTSADVIDIPFPLHEIGLSLSFALPTAVQYASSSSLNPSLPFGLPKICLL